MIMNRILFVVVAIFSYSGIILVAGEDKNKPEVTISDGKLRGSVEIARNGREYHRFLNIPYGTVEERFAVSKPAQAWNGTRDAIKMGPACLHLNFITNEIEGEEQNCLILNIYTPKISQKKLLPVMFFIHGGAYICGSANEYDGSFFMSEDIVLVAINYRLGPFGFLNAGIASASGNQGLKDQILALKWVQKNIKAFSGDPDRVLAFGESAGGISVSHLIMSPMAKGLFHAAITQSGFMTCPIAVQRGSDPLKEAQKLANLVDCPSSDPKFMIQCLRKIKSQEILKQLRFTHPTHFVFDTYEVPQFGPSVESFTDLPDSSVFYKVDPLQILFDGKFNKVPLMTGMTTHEGIFAIANVILNNDTLLELVDNEWGRVAPSTFLYRTTARDPCSMSSKIRKFYFEDEPISRANGDQLIDLSSDRWFGHCTRQGALLYAKHAPVYIYLLTHRGEKTFDVFEMDKDSDGRMGPTHGDDLIYQFPMTDWIPDSFSAGGLDEDFSIKMVGMWASFARDWKPTPWGDDVKEWPQFKTSQRPLQWLHLDNKLSIQSEDPSFTKRMEFWDELVKPLQTRYLDVGNTCHSTSRNANDNNGYCTN